MNKISSIESSRLVVTYRPVGELIPDPRNARTHSKRQIDQIRASIEAFGFTNPVLADPEGHIIAGHGRLQAARAMGLAELPVITLSDLSEVESRCGAVALGRKYLLPPLSSGGASIVPPWLRFHIPLIGRVEGWRAGRPLGRATFPVPSTSHAACGFPALRAPICFTPPLMGPILLGQLSARTR
jgi:hypothetical protein